MAEYKGRTQCRISGDDVDVYTDRNGMAYYKCGPTGIKVMHTIKRESDKFLAECFPEKSGESQAQVPVAPVKKAGFFDGVLS